MHQSRSSKVRQKHPDVPTLDHCWPQGEGGADEVGNLVALHRRCNNAKADAPPTGCELIWAQANAAALLNSYPWLLEHVAMASGANPFNDLPAL